MLGSDYHFMTEDVWVKNPINFIASGIILASYWVNLDTFNIGSRLLQCNYCNMVNL